MPTSIQWCDETWNPIRGCSRVSAGCDNCYAMGQAHRFSGSGKPYDGLTVLRRGKVDWLGKARLHPEMLDQPLRWKRPRRIFVNSMSDLFHESLSNEEIAAVFGVMAAASQHTFQVLTKRPKRMLEWFGWLTQPLDGQERIAQGFTWGGLGCRQESFKVAYGASTVMNDHGVALSLSVSEPWPLRNVHLGVSVEDQRSADERIPLLLQAPAAVRFISAEPLLGPVDLDVLDAGLLSSRNALDGTRGYSGFGGAPPRVTQEFGRGLDWAIVGGESGPGPRPCDVEWIRRIVHDCQTANVPVFVKQLGAKPYQSVSDATRGMGGIGLGLKDKKGSDPAEWPEGLRVREFPEVARG